MTNNISPSYDLVSLNRKYLNLCTLSTQWATPSLLTFLLHTTLSRSTGSIWPFVPHLHSGLLHLSGITYGGCSHPRLFPVSDLLVAIGKIPFSVNILSSTKSHLGLRAGWINGPSGTEIRVSVTVMILGPSIKIRTTVISFLMGCWWACIFKKCRWEIVKVLWIWDNKG